MRKIIIKQGNSLCLILTKNDREIYNLQRGDIVDIKIKKIKNGGKKK